MSKKTTIMKIIIPLVLIVFGILIMKALTIRRAEPEKEVRPSTGRLVTVSDVFQKDAEITVNATGTVAAAREISLAPQVEGRITYISPNMVTGGFFKQGDILFEIEDDDYRLAMERTMASKANAEFERSSMESRARIARSEWDRMNIKGKSDPNPLVLYEPQVKNAQAAVASANAAVEQAKLNLERTKVTAPFNVKVSSESIDVGQYIKSGNTVAMLSGTDSAEVIVPLPLDELHWIDIPRDGRSRGSAATVSFTTGTIEHQWHGHVVRSTGEVDPRSRMIQIIIEVMDPYGLKSKNRNPGPPLSIGTFVNVQIKGTTLKRVVTIPRTAYRSDSTVWLIDGEERLQIREVTPVYFTKDSAIISKGLSEGDRIVLTNISGAANGMKLRASEQ